MTLQTIWFTAVAVLWTGFLLLEGFDLGVAALLPVLGRDARDRHLLLRTIGPLWDGNEVWLVTAAGAVFAAFPGWYATWLPALYLPFVLVLLGLIVRAVAFEWRHQHPDPRWDAAWTRVITRGSLLAAPGVGAALAATTLGLPVDAHGTRVGGAFAGLGWPALLGAAAVVGFAVVHGALFLSLKTDGPVRHRARAFGVPCAWAQLRLDREGSAFAAWAGLLLASAATLFGAAYPVVLPSTVSRAYDVTIATASVSQYTLTVMTWVAAVGLPVV